MRVKVITAALTAVFMLLSAAPCLAGEAKVIADVPFVRQKDSFCGPAAMASVMQYYGQDVTQQEVAEAVFIQELNGALISDMENYAMAEGYKVTSTNGDTETLRKLIDEKVPVILLVDRGKWKVSTPHYYVVYGYDDDDGVFILHDGYNSGRKIDSDKLDGEWKKMNRLMLVVTK